MINLWFFYDDKFVQNEYNTMFEVKISKNITELDFKCKLKV